MCVLCCRFGLSRRSSDTLLFFCFFSPIGSLPPRFLLNFPFSILPLSSELYIESYVDHLLLCPILLFRRFLRKKRKNVIDATSVSFFDPWPSTIQESNRTILRSIGRFAR